MREKETGRSISRNLSARKFAVFFCYHNIIFAVISAIFLRWNFRASIKNINKKDSSVKCLEEGLCTIFVPVQPACLTLQNSS